MALNDLYISCQCKGLLFAELLREKELGGEKESVVIVGVLFYNPLQCYNRHILIK